MSASGNLYNFYSDSGATAARFMVVTGTVDKCLTGGRGAQFVNVSYSKIELSAAENAQQGLVVSAGVGNVIRGVYVDNGKDAANTYDGIVINSGTGNDVQVSSGNSGATGQRYGLNNTASYSNIHDCNFTRNQTDGLLSSGTNNTVRGNRLSVSATPGATQGTATLVAGAVTVITDEVRTGDLILLTCTTAGGTQGVVRVSAITNATSFVLTSSQGADTSTYAWRIEH
jgi:hypothetical protein